jgi:hypothetical protein
VRTPKTLVALDLSSKTGWAVYIDGKETNWGTLFIEKTVKDFGSYPANYVKLAKHIAVQIYHQVLSVYWPDQIVIEETNASRQNYSQKLLESIHYALIDMLLVSESKGPNWKVDYVRTGEWRRSVEAKQNAEEKKLNSKIAREKAKRKVQVMADKSLSETEKKKILRLPIKIDGKVVGRKGRKHVAIRVAQEMFGVEFKRKDEDAVDALLLGKAYLNGAPICDGTVNGGKSKKE